MKISRADISQLFDELLSGASTKEAVSNRAIELEEEFDNRNLEFDPPEDREVIWSAIKYLTGVDLKTSPDTYLHDNEDFAAYRREKGL